MDEKKKDDILIPGHAVVCKKYEAQPLLGAKLLKWLTRNFSLP